MSSVQRHERELGERPPEHQADRGPPAGDGSVDPEGAGPLTRLDEGRREQREGGRCHDRGKRTLQGACAEEHGGTLGESAERRGEREPHQSEEERAAAADVVGDPAPEQQQAPEREGVRGHHPLAVGDRDVQRALGGGQRDDHDRGVENHHELGEGEEEEGTEPARVGTWLCCGGIEKGHGSSGGPERG